VPRILEGPAWDGRSVLFIVFDEGHGSEPIPFVVVGPVVRPGFRSAVPHDHYSLLRTIENAWGLPCLASACRANTLAELFGPN